MRKNLKIIIKIGSSSLVNHDLSINEPMMYDLSKQLKILLDNNCHPLLVTSGAIAVGRNVLGLSNKPKSLSLKQACAAVGQAKLMENYNKAFDVFKIKAGQVLLSHDDFQSRKRINYLKSCLNTMIDENIIPIINENDVVSVDEIKVGDNDTLSGLICPLVDADMLIILSDIDGLYDSNPQENKDAKFISEVKTMTDEIKMMAGGSSTTVGTGGMSTKIKAAEIASNSGCKTMIMNAKKINLLHEILDGKILGTLFYENDKYLCIIPIINNIDTYPLCYNGNSKIDYHLTDDDMKSNFIDYIKEYDSLNDNYNNISINNLVNKSYLIWNYNGFYYINEK